MIRRWLQTAFRQVGHARERYPVCSLTRDIKRSGGPERPDKMLVVGTSSDQRREL